MLGCPPARTTHGSGTVRSALPRRDGGGAAQMAQMARVGFRTVGNWNGHQVTTAQLAVLPGQRKELGARGNFWSEAVGCEGLKVLALLWMPPNPGWPVPPSATLHLARAISSERLWALGAESLKRHGTSPSPRPGAGLTSRMQARNRASRPAGGCRLAQLCVLQPARLPPGRLTGNHTSFVCQHPHALCPLESLLPRPTILSSSLGPSIKRLA